MNANNNISTHLDKSVIYLFAAVFLVAFISLGFRYANNTPCDEVLFVHSAKEYRAGEMIKFNDKSIDALNWEWNFGDGSAISTQKDPLHIFATEGEYTVQLTINNSCEKTETIVIKEKRVLLDSTKFPVFTLPKTIVVGQKLEVRDQTKNASSWEWRFGETASVNATTKTAKYQYEEPGLKTVSLIVNGDLNYIQKKKINVLPSVKSKEQITKIARERRDKRLDLSKAPPGTNKGKEPDANKPNVVPFITIANFQNKIKMVANNKLSPQTFSEFFCGDVNPLVVVNGRSTTFLILCEKIKGKKINIKSLNLIRNKGSNCIKTFTIEYKKSGLF